MLIIYFISYEKELLLFAAGVELKAGKKKMRTKSTCFSILTTSPLYLTFRLQD